MEYIGIAEFAERVGVTPQAVYRRLKTDLEPYLKEESGVKLLSVEALNLYQPKQPSKEAQRIQELESLVSLLQEDKHALTLKVAELTEKMADMMLEHAKQTENFQVLLAQNQQLQQSLIQSISTVENMSKHLELIETSVTKQSFFKRLFAPKRVDKV